MKQLWPSWCETDQSDKKFLHHSSIVSPYQFVSWKSYTPRPEAINFWDRHHCQMAQGNEWSNNWCLVVETHNSCGGWSSGKRSAFCWHWYGYNRMSRSTSRTLRWITILAPYHVTFSKLYATQLWAKYTDILHAAATMKM